MPFGLRYAWWGIICLALTASCGGDGTNLSIDAPDCRQSPFGGAQLQGQSERYAAVLMRLEARPLCMDADSDDLLQLLWMPSFHPEAVVTLRIGGDSTTLTGRVAGAASDALRRPQQTVVVLDSAGLADFESVFGASDFWHTTTDAPPSDWACLDGARIVLERLVAGRYHVVARHSCDFEDAEGIKDLASWLLTRAAIVDKDTFDSY